MAKLIYFACFLFASYFVATKAQTNCSSPVAEALGIELLATPAPRPSGVKICGTITGNVCCGADTFTSIEEGFQTFRTAIDTVVTALKNLKAPAFPAFDDLFDQVGGCRNSLFLGTGLTCDDVEQLYNRITNALKDYYKNLPDNLGTCLQGLLQFFAGTICFLCDASWGEYISVANSGNIVFNLANDVCSDVSEACLPLYQGVQDLYSEIIDAAADLGPFGDTVFASVAGDVPNICSDDCLQFICYVVISGYEAKLINPFEGVTTGRTNDEEIPSFFRNMRQAVDDGLDPIRRLLAAHHEATNQFARTVKAAQAGESQYSANGFKATEVGRESSLNTEVEGADDGDDDDSASTVFASILAVLAALALLF